VPTLSSASRAALLDAARAALVCALKSAPPPLSAPPAGTEELNESSGCFVSLHEQMTHRLRGCVGRLDPEKSLWEAVHLTAADVLRDPRFMHDNPVTIEEAPNLEIEISVLSPPRPADSPLDFDLLNDGIYLTFSNRAGFFLPQVARETGWTKEQLLTRLCTEKLGLPADTWKNPDAKLFTFKVEVVGPEPV
jgi:AmmeMemoRadiSam system protein A